MGNSNKKKPKPALTAHELQQSLGPVFKTFHQSNDMACVLVATSYLEDALKTILRKFFIEKSDNADEILDHKFNGFLTELSSRNKLAYCLGLITSEQHDALIKIATIRNLFAHTHPERTFVDPEIKASCEGLPSGDSAIPQYDPEGKVTKLHFSNVAASLAMELYKAAFKIKHRKPKSIPKRRGHK